MALGFLAGVSARGEDARRDLRVGLAPTGPERISKLNPVGRMLQRAVAHTELHSLEVVTALDEAVVDLDVETELRRDGLGGLARALEWRGDDEPDVVVGEGSSHRRRHRLARFGKPKAGKSAIEDAGRVVDLAVTNEVDDCLAHDQSTSAHAAAARFAAVAMRSTTRSSCAAPTNHAS